jgi:hypothetical protein
MTIVLFTTANRAITTIATALLNFGWPSAASFANIVYWNSGQLGLRGERTSIVRIESACRLVGRFGFSSAGSNGAGSVVALVCRMITSFVFLYSRVKLVMLCFIHMTSFRGHHYQALSYWQEQIFVGH